MKYDDKEFNEINKIISAISTRSSYKFKSLSQEDISQQLWLKVVDEESKKGYHLDKDLIATICYCEIVNMQRYEMRRNHYNLENDENITDRKNIYETIEVEEILNLFPKDSLERTVVEYWCASIGLIYDEKYINPNKKSYKDGFTENYLAQILGFGSSTHRGYKALRERVRRVIKKYFEK